MPTPNDALAAVTEKDQARQDARRVLTRWADTDAEIVVTDAEMSRLVAWVSALVLDQRATARAEGIAAERERSKALVEAAEALKADLRMRARFDSDALAVVAAGNGVWFAFCQALNAASAADDRQP